MSTHTMELYFEFSRVFLVILTFTRVADLVKLPFSSFEGFQQHNPVKLMQLCGQYRTTKLVARKMPSAGGSGSFGEFL